MRSTISRSIAADNPPQVQGIDTTHRRILYVGTPDCKAHGEQGGALVTFWLVEYAMHPCGSPDSWCGVLQVADEGRSVTTRPIMQSDLLRYARRAKHIGCTQLLKRNDKWRVCRKLERSASHVTHH